MSNVINLAPLFEAQRKLDERIIREKKLEGQDLLPNSILALQVELGELANEWRGFKHWSNDREPRNSDICPSCSGRGFWFDGNRVGCIMCDRTGKVASPMLVEYVDCLSFILSIGLQLGYTNVEYLDVPEPKDETTTELFNGLFWHVACLDTRDFGRYTAVFTVFIDLGEMLGFTWEQIEGAYYAKNKINHERQASGY